MKPCTVNGEENRKGGRDFESSSIFEENCLFCRIVLSKEPAHRVYEDDDFLAFLTIFPISPGVTVVIPKKHYESNVLTLPNEVYHGLLDKARLVGVALQGAFAAERTALVAEGLMINHAHLKLYPLILGEKSPRFGVPTCGAFQEYYQGFISTLEGPRCDDDTLAKWTQRIRCSLNGLLKK